MRKKYNFCCLEGTTWVSNNNNNNHIRDEI